jgi:hypothetical protein
MKKIFATSAARKLINQGREIRVEVENEDS